MQHVYKDLHKIRPLANFNAVNLYAKTGMILFCSCVFLWGQKFTANIAIVEKLTLSVLDSVSREHPPADSAGISLSAVNIGGEKNFFLRNCFLNNFPAEGRSVVRDNGAQQFVLTEFAAQTVYREDGAGLLGFNDKIYRQVSVHLKGRLEDTAGGQVLSTFQRSLSYRDVITRESLPQIDKSAYTFSRGRMESFSRWSRFSEPAIALVSVVSMIYLLFSVRF